MAFSTNPRASIDAPTLVPRERLANAVSLSSASMQVASIAGPALMGLVIARHSPGARLLHQRGVVPRRDTRAGGDASPAGGRRPRQHLESATTRRSKGCGSCGRRAAAGLMLLDFLATFFSSANTLLPMFADRVLHVGAQAYGLLAAAPAAGALLTDW